VAVLTSALLKLQNSMDDKFNKVMTKLEEVKKAAAAAKPASNKRQPDTTVYNVNIGDSPYLGAKDAAVTIVEFTGFQCPYCIREVPKLKKLIEDYPNDVKVVLKHYPLSFHKKAKPASAAAIFAQKQKGNDGFWEMHDKIIAGGTKKLDIPVLRTYAEEMALDLAAFDAIMASPAEIDKLLKPDMDEAAKCKVRGTPTVMVNGLKQSPRTPEAYKARIDQILADKKKGKA
jgi:protein-disulfide isomerase